MNRRIYFLFVFFIIISCSRKQVVFHKIEGATQKFTIRDSRGKMSYSVIERFVIENPPEEKSKLIKAIITFNNSTLSKKYLHEHYLLTRMFYKESWDTPIDFKEGKEGFFSWGPDSIETHLEDNIAVVQWSDYGKKKNTFFSGTYSNADFDHEKIKKNIQNSKNPSSYEAIMMKITKVESLQLRAILLNSYPSEKNLSLPLIRLSNDRIHGRTIILYDNKHRIRVYISYYHEQDDSTKMSYYDAEGNILMMLFDERAHSDCSGYGKIIFREGEIVYHDIISDCCDGDAGAGITEMKKCNGIYQGLAIQKNVEDIKKAHGLQDVPASNIILKARRPEIGEETFINSSNVLARSMPSLKGKVVFKLRPFDPVRIDSYERGETIPPWGKHPWVKVSYKVSLSKRKYGYVFGAFVQKVFEKK